MPFRLFFISQQQLAKSFISGAFLGHEAHLIPPISRSDNILNSNKLNQSFHIVSHQDIRNGQNGIQSIYRPINNSILGNSTDFFLNSFRIYVVFCNIFLNWEWVDSHRLWNNAKLSTYKGSGNSLCCLSGLGHLSSLFWT